MGRQQLPPLAAEFLIEPPLGILIDANQSPALAPGIEKDRLAGAGRAVGDPAVGERGAGMQQV